ncbi:MAG: enoyl-CoA hydratase/isomerase family protein [Bacteroides sp.]|jgi:enoyl-CoA hydratase|nr:enoyl-CoA hydratase/isomerase family protein [Bacteroides sp.]
MDYKTLKYYQEGPVGILTISRPEVLNALNDHLMFEMHHFVLSIGCREGLRALILTGEGKAFASGGDISEMQHLDASRAYDFSRKGQINLQRLADLEIPLIAAVNGYALGGGFELALVCDFITASTDARFAFPETSLGIIPGYGGSQRITRRCGLSNGLFLMLTSEMIDAFEARRMGLVQKIFEPTELIPNTIALANKIAKNGPNAIKMAKKLGREGMVLSFEKALELERELFSSLFETDGPEGLKAFVEKRKPQWRE